MSNPIQDEQLTENLRQERETFDQHKAQQAQWFRLRLRMGYLSLIMLPAILGLSAYIVFKHSQFPDEVVTAAAGALFIDVLGLIGCVWKIVLNPGLMTRLAPVTSERATAENNTEEKTNLIEDPKKALLILSAVYGTKDESEDVTERIKSKIKDDKLEIPVNNSEMGGDPHPSKRKRLEITYSWNDKIRTTSFTERDTLKLP